MNNESQTVKRKRKRKPEQHPQYTENGTKYFRNLEPRTKPLAEPRRMDAGIIKDSQTPKAAADQQKMQYLEKGRENDAQRTDRKRRIDDIGDTVKRPSRWHCRANIGQYSRKDLVTSISTKTYVAKHGGAEAAQEDSADVSKPTALPPSSNGTHAHHDDPALSLRLSPPTEAVGNIDHSHQAHEHMLNMNAHTMENEHVTKAVAIDGKDAVAGGQTCALMLAIPPPPKAEVYTGDKAAPHNATSAETVAMQDIDSREQLPGNCKSVDRISNFNATKRKNLQNHEIHPVNSDYPIHAGARGKRVRLKNHVGNKVDEPNSTGALHVIDMHRCDAGHYKVMGSPAARFKDLLSKLS